MNKQTELEQEAGRRALARRASASPNSAKAQVAEVEEAPKKRTRKSRTVVSDAPLEPSEVEAQAPAEDELDALLKD